MAVIFNWQDGCQEKMNQHYLQTKEVLCYTDFLHSGKYTWKFYLIIISLMVLSINIYAQNPWKQVSALVHSRSGATACVINDKIHVLGGYTTTNHAYNEVYDPSSSTWELKAPMPTARGFLSSVVLDGYLCNRWRLPNCDKKSGSVQSCYKYMGQQKKI